MTETATPPQRPDVEDEEVLTAFRRSVEEGEVRLGRSWPDLLATGFLGGIDIGIGVLALLVVEEATGSRVLGSLAFTVGFVALHLARSELFTENLLVPVTAVVARRATVASLLRLWAGTLVANLAGAQLVTWLTITAFPRVRPVAVDLASTYPELGFGSAELFAMSVLGGVAITLMTWMERQADSEGVALVGTAAVAFLLAVAPLSHVIVSSVEMFAALHAGAPFGYADWLVVTVWVLLANLVGGLVLTTLVRLVQVGSGEIRRARADT